MSLSAIFGCVAFGLLLLIIGALALVALGAWRNPKKGTGQGD